MIKCLVCVGTSSFDSLLKIIDGIRIDNLEITIQYGTSSYVPVNHKSFKWCDDFIKYASEFDFIITHAGAGTVYGLLELSAKLLVIPNLERVDHHQLELAKFVDENKYGYVCYDLSDLELMMVQFTIGKLYLNQYEKEDFFFTERILEVIKNEFN